MERKTVYLDNQATTPVDERVLDAMMPALTTTYGNPASRSHRLGWDAEELVSRAREKVAETIGASPREIIFTSGATESDNLAVKGVVGFYRDKGRHVVTVATEHRAILDPCRSLARRGQIELTVVKPNANGLVDLDRLSESIRDDTVLVSVMHANNEIGVIQPISEIGRLVRARGAVFHTDAAQSVGKVAVDVDALNVDLLSLSAHKIYGPKGVGALYVRSRGPRVRLEAQIDGGGHERGMRSGTLNVAGVVGLGKACEIASQEMPSESKRIGSLRDLLAARLFGELDQICVNGDMDERLPGNLNVSFMFVEGESLMMGLKDVAVSSGSACSSATMEPSYVLRALGLSDELAHSSIRFGIGRFNDRSDIEYTAKRVIAEVRRLRALSPLYQPAREGVA
ncbi:MAG: IscS subfamily cysteine desulfurase [Candidatus Binatia bacterium]